MRAALIAVICACRFSPGAQQQPDDGNPPAEAGIDAPPVDAMVDGNDALESSARRKPITFNNKIIGTNTDFPVWIDYTNNDLKMRAHANDIYFTDADGTTKLDRQVMLFDATNGHLQAWVRVPSLANGSKIYLYYGDPGAVDAANPVGVFENGFKAVWHLDEVNANVVDATNQTNAVGAFSAATTVVDSPLGKGLQWAESMDNATFTNPLLGNTAHTISVWAYQNDIHNDSHTSSILNLGAPSGGHARWLYGHYVAQTWYVGFYGPDIAANDNIEDNKWHLLTWVFPGGANVTSSLWADGVKVSFATVGTIDTQAGGVIGHAPENVGWGNRNGFEGKMDELRLANVARDDNWIKTEWANQSNPGSTYAVGGEENPP
ncbi:MAG: DUF2341 domain-containing protein [Kofleriaceae bacterium]